jgi:hypothetical protein
MRLELGQANNVEVPEPSFADDRVQPAIVMIGRVSGRSSPECGEPLLSTGPVLVVADTTVVVVADACFSPPPEHAVTQRTKAARHAPHEHLVTASV